jgi:hypothetical protein
MIFEESNKQSITNNVQIDIPTTIKLKKDTSLVLILI